MGTGRRRLIFAIIAFLAVAITGIATLVRPAESVPVAGQSMTLSASEAALAPPGPVLGVQRGGDLLAWLSSQPSPPARGDAALDAYIVDSSGQPVADAVVTFDTDMTNMTHGKNLVGAKPVGNGHYAGTVRFMMPGPWRVVVVVERAGKDPVKLRFDFPVRMR